jgi:hypothetical protein
VVGVGARVVWVNKRRGITARPGGQAGRQVEKTLPRKRETPRAGRWALFWATASPRPLYVAHTYPMRSPHRARGCSDMGRAVRMHSRECHKSRPGWGLRDAPAETCIGVDFRDASGTDCPESLSANVRR